MSSAGQRMPHRSAARRRLTALGSAIALAAVVAASLTWAERASAQQSAALKVDPASANVALNAETTVKIVQNAGVVSIGVEADVNFDANVLQIVSVTKGAAYETGASFVMGVAPQTKDEAIAAANSSGQLLNLATFFAPGAGTVTAGEKEAFVITFKGKANGTSPVRLTGTSMLDEGGVEITVNVTDGQVVTGAGGAPAVPTATAGAGGAAPPTGQVAGVEEVPGKKGPVAGFGPLPGDSTLWIFWLGAAALIIALLASGAVTLRGARRS